MANGGWRGRVSQSSSVAVTATDTHRAIEAVWRIESARLIAGLARMVRDVGLAEELAQDALVAALEQWPESGVPDNPGAWLMATAKHRAIDQLRRRKLPERKHEELGREIEVEREMAAPDLDAALDDDVGDDLLRLVFIACHPVLPTEARVALTLRLLGGLTTEEIARAFLVPGADDRAAHRPRQADAGRGPCAVRGPTRGELASHGFVGARGGLPRLQRGLLGDGRRRLDAARALRRGAATRPHPGRARSAGAGGARPRRADGDPGFACARADRPAGEPILLLDQNRARWDQLLIGRGLAALAARRRRSAEPLGPYALQAAIAACHARARTADETDWARIAALYDALAQLDAVADRRAESRGRGRNGVRAGSRPRDRRHPEAEPSLKAYHLLPPCAATSWQSWGVRAGARRVRARRGADTKCSRARRAAARARAARSRAGSERNE